MIPVSSVFENMIGRGNVRFWSKVAPHQELARLSGIDPMWTLLKVATYS